MKSQAKAFRQKNGVTNELNSKKVSHKFCCLPAKINKNRKENELSILKLFYSNQQINIIKWYIPLKLGILMKMNFILILSKKTKKILDGIIFKKIKLLAGKEFELEKKINSVAAQERGWSRLTNIIIWFKGSLTFKPIEFFLYLVSF